MKTKKLNLLAFKKEELSRENSFLVKAGEPIKPKPTSTVSGTGAGTGGYCYYDLETGTVICEPIVTNEDPTSDI